MGLNFLIFNLSLTSNILCIYTVTNIAYNVKFPIEIKIPEWYNRKMSTKDRIGRHGDIFQFGIYFSFFSGIFSRLLYNTKEIQGMGAASWKRYFLCRRRVILCAFAACGSVAESFLCKKNIFLQGYAQRTKIDRKSVV